MRVDKLVPAGSRFRQKLSDILQNNSDRLFDFDHILQSPAALITMNLANVANAVFVTFQLPAKYGQCPPAATSNNSVAHSGIPGSDKSYRAFYKTILIVCSILMAFCACWQAGSSQSVLFHDGDKMFQSFAFRVA